MSDTKRALCNIVGQGVADNATLEYIIDRLLAHIAESPDQSVLNAIRLVKPMSNPEARAALAAAMRAIGGGQ